LEQAEARLAELEKADPDSFTTVSVKARLRQAQRRGDEAVALVKKYAEDKPAGMLVLAAGLLEEIGQTDAAEEMYRRFVDRSGRPDDVLVLIQFLARRQRLDEALSLCEKAWGTCPAEAVGAVSAAALRLGKSRPEHQKRVESWLRKACEQAPASVSLQISLADVYELQGHYDDAQQIYRRVAAGKIPSIIALNNLAWLLTLKEQKAEEALPYIEAAVKLAGPLPELLDTRAVVHIGRGRPDLAIKDLKEAIAQAPTPSRYFHLAQAHQLAQDRKGAREALQKAQALGLQPEGLHPLEQGSYRRLAAELP
jgi:tetratricopeptide (TPR) repeat protein